MGILYECDWRDEDKFFERGLSLRQPDGCYLPLRIILCKMHSGGLLLGRRREMIPKRKRLSV